MTRLAAALAAAAVLGAAGCSSVGGVTDAVYSGDANRVLVYSRGHDSTITATGRKVRTLDLSLYIAARKGDVAMMRELIKNGADPKIPDVLEVAAQFDQYAAAQLLLSEGADPTAAPKWGGTATPMDTAVKSRRVEIVRLMVEHTGKASTPAPAPVAAADASASDAEPGPERAAERPFDFALVIGIEKYSKLPDARFAENDADTVKRHLIALGFPERNIILLKGGQATRGAISGYVEEWLPRNALPSSRVFVYFSGHGSPDPKTGDAYLVPWDGDASFLKSTAYPLKTLYASLGRLNAKRVLVALDSCFSGAGGRSVLAQGARPLVGRVAAVTAPPGITVLSAAAGDEITSTVPSQGHGAFTYHLLKALKAGKLTAKAAFDDLKPRVQDEARRQNRDQTPQLAGDDAPF